MSDLTWPQRVRDLQAAGMTYAQIAVRTGLAPSTIGDLANGRSLAPRGDAAVVLYKLHLEIMNPPPEDQERAA